MPVPTQTHLERFFGIVRGRSSNSHMTPGDYTRIVARLIQLLMSQQATDQMLREQAMSTGIVTASPQIPRPYAHKAPVVDAAAAVQPDDDPLICQATALLSRLKDNCVRESSTCTV